MKNPARRQILARANSQMMKREHLYLCSSTPYNFSGYCTACHRQTDRMVAEDVSERNLPLVLVELVVHPLAVLRLKSVSVPYCQICSGLLNVLRATTALVSIILLCALVYVIFGENPKFKESDAGMYLMVACLFGVILIPFVYTALKEKCLGVNVFFQGGVFYFRFGTPKVPQFLERKELCKRSSGNDKVWVAVETAHGHKLR